ncbi:winged helix-turn-helix domain-containing tetratricopeptide repeat protein [Marinihelvus fidelis]|uniref:winged helix-turn-helix domain-containing tetratricopeptide repeat protein n=1 Tax=Marinihelvus fidelis TaxID=2613842 RepID=UPI00177DA42B|nr:winged helix-turn-helix domain-containing protein [Marinihelvus fidelis]
MSSECYRIGGVILNAGTQEVRRAGVTVPLPPLSFQLLLMLARNAPNVVTTRELEAEVWSGVVVDRGTINKRVVLVRNALRDAGCIQDYIAVVRGTGYRLAVQVEAVDCSAMDTTEAIEEIPVAEPEVALPAQPSSVDRPFWTWVAVAAVVFVLVVMGYWSVMHSHDDVAPESGSPVAIELSAPYSVAILPFEVHGSEPGGAELAASAAMEIEQRLSAVEGLEVLLPEEGEYAAVSSAPAIDLGARLGVDSIIRGVVHPYDDRLVLVLNQEDARTGQVLWARSFDRPVEALPALMEDVVRNVVQQGGASESHHGDVTSVTQNIPAFSHYLAGRALMNDRMNTGLDGISEAQARFDEAIRLDPTYLQAHVALAASHFLLAAYDDPANKNEHLARAESSARYALEMEPASSDALGVLAAVMASQGEASQAASLYERAYELGGRDTNVLHWHAMLFNSMGYFEPLVPMLETAWQDDPLSPLLACSLAGTLTLAGHPEDAIQILIGMPRFDRRDLILGLASLYLGDFDNARQMFSGLQVRNGELSAEYANLLVDAFEYPLRRETVESGMVEEAHEGRLDPYLAFEILMLMGSPRAFDLEIDYGNSDFGYRMPEEIWSNWGVELRRDPRFKGWVRQLGYDRYWRKFGWPDRCKPTGRDDFECV